MNTEYLWTPLEDTGWEGKGGSPWKRTCVQRGFVISTGEPRECSNVDGKSLVWKKWLNTQEKGVGDAPWGSWKVGLEDGQWRTP